MNKRGQFVVEFETTFNGLDYAEALQVGGQSLLPNKDLAYLEARCAYGLPMVNTLGQAMLPQVIARSASSWVGKVFNVGHAMKSYDAKSILRDRIIGHVAAAEFVGAPADPAGSPWPIPADRLEAPHCRLALAVFKAAEMVPGIFGNTQAGRKKWTVSMEVRWILDQCAFAWKRNLMPVTNALDFGGGWEGLTWDKAPADLRACWDDAAEGGLGAVTKPWNRRDVVLLLGGLDYGVEFQGIGLVNEGREPGAHIRRLLAGRLDGALPDEGELQGLQDLAGALELVRLNQLLQGARGA